MTAGTQYQNVTIVKGGPYVPEDAPPSPPPQAEKVLLDHPEWRLAFGSAPEAAPVIITPEALAAWDALRQDVADASDSGRALLEEWYHSARTEVFRHLPVWYRPAIDAVEKTLARRAEVLGAEDAVSPAVQEAPDPGGEDGPEETAPDQTSVMEPVTQLVPRVDGGTAS